MCRKRIWLVVLGLALSLAIGLPCGQAAEPNTPSCVKAASPSPADQAVDVRRDGTALKWSGDAAGTYDVYFGVSATDVAAANRAKPAGIGVSTGQKAATYVLGRLDLGRTYYWRIDKVAVNTADPNAPTICPGDVWSFTVEPAVLPIANVTATAACSIYDYMGPSKTVDGSGITGDLHSADMLDMWLSCLSKPDPNKPDAEINWIQFGFDKVYKLDQMWVWNWNSVVEKLFGLGVKDATVKYSTNGTDWTTLGDFKFARAPGTAGYKYNTVVNFAGVVAKSVRIVIKSSHLGYPEYGLSEVRLLYVPVFPTEPNPASGTKMVPLDGVLSWRAGREAASHKVYLSTDKQAVINGTVTPRTVTTNSLSLGPLNLELDKTYYWKVEEVNDAATPKSWAGDVWSFSTIDYLVVEDFEKYTNNLSGTWKSDYSAGTSAIEKNVVYGGKQSMLLTYDMSNNPYEVVAGSRALSRTDWTAKGVKKLVVFFHGDPLNKIDPLFVVVNGKKVVYNGSTKNPWWSYWTIDLSSLGVILPNIEWMTLGVGSYDRVKGKVYVDEVRLYQKTPTIVSIVDQLMSLNAQGATKGQFDLFLTALAAADPKVLDALSSEAPYTVFAPTDDAFAAAGIGTKEILGLDRAVLTAIMQYHIVAGKVAADNTGDLKTLQGTVLQQAGKSLTDALGGKASITLTTEASNGLIHTVDAILWPFKP